jgi:hypothetical protein
MLPIVWGILAISAAVAGYAVYNYWEEIQEWAKRILPGILTMVKGVVSGRLELVREGYEFIKRVIVFELIRGEYYQHTRSEKVSASEVPDDIKEELRRKQSIHQTLELQH